MSSSSSSDNNDNDNDNNNNDTPHSGTLARFAFFSAISFFYWYVLVLGAAVNANGLPIPDFIPMVPGWPVSDSDLAPVLEDSFHFFYLSELLQNPDAPYVSPPRLAVFNLVEAWIFAMLPVLWKDSRRRLPRPVLLVTWLALGINLTNAFLAPYLAITELRGGSSLAAAASSEDDESDGDVEKNPIVSGLFAIIAIAVVGHALSESVTVATAGDWSEFVELARTDRTYLAFCLDPIVFAVLQPFLLARIKPDESLEPLDYVPFVGLMLWLVTNEKEGTRVDE
jgi:hypothetical protein